MKKELACPLCGGRVIETAKGFACENWPGVKGACRFTVWKESYGAGFDEGDVERLVAGESVRKVNTSKDGSKYEADWMLSEDEKKPVFVRAEDDAEEERPGRYGGRDSRIRVNGLDGEKNFVK